MYTTMKHNVNTRDWSTSVSGLDAGKRDTKRTARRNAVTCTNSLVLHIPLNAFCDSCGTTYTAPRKQYAAQAPAGRSPC